MVWHREELSRRIELQPFLRYFFFGRPQYPTFVPWNQYFDEIEKDLLSVPATEIPMFEKYVSEIEGFLLSETKKILVIHSPGGCGKSHFLRELAQISHKIDPKRQPWLVRAGYRKMEDALQDEIVAGRQYLFLFDDVDRYLEDAKTLLAFSQIEKTSVKYILSCRSSGFRFINDIIRELRFELIANHIDISDWSKDDLVQLLRIAAEEGEIEYEELIATLYPNPFLIVWIGKRLKEEPTLDLETIKEKFVNEIEYDTKKSLSEIIDSSMIKDFLINLSCIVPFSNENEHISKILGETLNLEVNIIRQAIDTLRQVGILRIVGRFLRFNPDMIGDLYFAYRLERTTDQKKRDLLARWLHVAPEKVFINIEAAARYTDTSTLETILSEIVYSWIEEAESTPNYIRIEILKFAEKIAFLVPTNSLNLLYTYLNSIGPPPDDPFLKFLDINPTTDDYGPVIVKLLETLSIKNEVIDLNEIINFIEQLDKKDIDGTFEDYKPYYLLKNYILTSIIRLSTSPLYNNIDLIHKILDIFMEWLDEPNSSRIKIISGILTEILAGSHHYTKSSIEKLFFGEITLADTSEIRGIRDKALQILKKMITQSSLDVKIKGIYVAGKIGKTIWRIKEKDIPLADKIVTEREEIVDEIGEIISPETDFQILNAIEHLFLEWWAQKKQGTDKCRDYLSDFPQDIEYRVFKFFVSDFLVEDFESIEGQAPEEKRWNWFVDNFMYRPITLESEGFQTLVESLNEKYNAEDLVIIFLTSLDERLTSYSTHSHPPIITCWVKFNPDLFLSIQNSDDLWEQIPQRFKMEIDLAVADLDEEFIQKLADKIMSALPAPLVSTTETFLKLLGRHSTEDLPIDFWLSELLDNGNLATRRIVVNYLRFIFEKTKNCELTIKLLHLVILKEKELTEAMLPNIWFTIHSLRGHMDSIEEEEIDEVRKELLQKLKDIPIIDYYAQELLDFAFYGLDSVIGFIEYRLTKFEGRYPYEAIPSDGINGVVNQIKSFNDYKRIIEKVIIWYEEDIFRFYLKDLMEPLGSFLNDISGRLYLEEYIETQIQVDHIKNAIIASMFLPFNEDTIPVFIKVAEKGIDQGETQSIKKLLDNKRRITSLLSRRGEPPPALVARKTLFEKMYEKTKPGILRTLVERCIEAIEREIESDIKRDEEFLHPRG